MKTVYALIFLCFSTTYAYGSCFKHELKGRIKIKKSELTLILAEGTASELSLPIPQEAQHKFAPYINKYVEGIFILNAESPTAGSKLLKTEKIKNSVFDPLNQNLANTRKQMGEAPCS